MGSDVSLTSFGLSMSFLGTLFLLYYAERQQRWKIRLGDKGDRVEAMEGISVTTKAERDMAVSPWWYRLGYGLLALGFLVAVCADVFNL